MAKITSGAFGFSFLTGVYAGEPWLLRQLSVPWELPF